MQAGKEIKLSDLLLGTVNVQLDLLDDCMINGIAIDSRNVQSGDLFLAYSGSKVDGKDFIIEAVHNGAVAVLCEDKLSEQMAVAKTVPVVVVPNLRKQAGFIAAKFYGYPAKKLQVIGVTGTNGKTSITQYIAAILTDIGIACGVIGTIGVGFPGKLMASANTTPDPVVLQRWLFDLMTAGAKVVAMEVSSQGLEQGRVHGVDFATVVFTNLTRDHLDTHGTMLNYGKAKKLLFTQHNLRHAVINGDDEFGRGLIQEFKNSFDMYAYTTTDYVPSFAGIPVIAAQNINIDVNKIVADLVTPWGNGVLKSTLLGRFNLSNLLAVVAVLGIMNIDLNQILASISRLKSVVGRMQAFGGDKKPLVIVDYAHTPDALEKALLSLREYCRGSLWCVFGCGGDKDKGKRPMMGQAVERYSDHVVITNDNPRTEDPKLIVNDILRGLLCPWAVEVEYDRAAAIEYAINSANDNDIILVAGKGHEDYQIIGEERVVFSDAEVVVDALGAKDFLHNQRL